MKSTFLLALVLLGMVAAAPSHAQSTNPLMLPPSVGGVEPLLGGDEAQDSFALEPFLGAGDKPPLTLNVVLGYASLATTAVLLHEIGHALIDAHDIPIAGSEEDAADEFAAIVLIHNAELDPAHHDTLSAMVRYFLDIWTFDKPALTNDVTAAYWDTHSLSRKRAYDILCLMVGAFPERYGEVLQAHTDSPEQHALTRASCVAQYERKAKAWDRLLAGILKPVQGPPAPGEPRFALEFLPPITVLGAFFDRLHETQPILPSVVDWLNSVLFLPPGSGDIRVEAGECGDDNAFYSPASRSVTYCYELTAAQAMSFINAESGANLDNIGAFFDWVVAQQEREAIAALAGAWTAQAKADDGRDLVQSYRFNTDKTFRQIETGGDQEILMDGRFSVEGILLGPVAVTLTPLVWTPAKLCSDLQKTDCRDIRFPENWTIPLIAWSRDSVSLGDRTFRRDPNAPQAPIIGRWSGNFREALSARPILMSLLEPDVTVTFGPDSIFRWSGKWPDSRGCRVEATGTYSEEGDTLSLWAGLKSPTATQPDCDAGSLPLKTSFRIGSRDAQRLDLNNGVLEGLELKREGSRLLSLAPRR